VIPVAWLLTLTGVVVTLVVFVSGVIFRTGHQAARLEELEKWRGSVRQDMHEVSDTLEGVRVELKRLATIIEERTRQRRYVDEAQN
jgi:trehalose-6-phosphatase